MIKPIVFILIVVMCIADFFFTGMIISTPEEEKNILLSALYEQFGFNSILYMKLFFASMFVIMYRHLKWWMYYPVFFVYLFVIIYEIWILSLS